MGTRLPSDMNMVCWSCRLPITSVYYCEGGRPDRPVHKGCRSVTSGGKAVKRLGEAPLESVRFRNAMKGKRDE